MDKLIKGAETIGERKKVKSETRHPWVQEVREKRILQVSTRRGISKNPSITVRLKLAPEAIFHADSVTASENRQLNPKTIENEKQGRDDNLYSLGYRPHSARELHS